MGYGVSGSVFAGMLHGCQVDAALDWEPLFFTPDQARTLAAVADHILPRTQTPGASDVFVERFIDQIVNDCYTAGQQQRFAEGLAAFEEACRQRYGKAFTELSDEQKDNLLTTLEAQPMQPARYLWGNLIAAGGKPSFYRELKGLCLFGYFSSEQVGEQVLNYDPIPGKFVGCVPLAEIGNAWSL